jgi:hypothetical protein
MKPFMKALEMTMDYSCLKTDSKLIPEIKNWKTGEKYKMEVEVVMRETELCDDNKTIDAEFEVKRVKVM